MYPVASYSDEAWSRLGDQVRRARVSRGWTQEELAQDAGVATGTVRNLENGRRARDLNVVRITRALGWVNDSYLLVLEGGSPVVEDGTPEPEPEPDDTLRVERPPGLTDEEWSSISEKLVEDLQFWLRHRRP